MASSFIMLSFYKIFYLLFLSLFERERGECACLHIRNGGQAERERESESQNLYLGREFHEDLIEG